MLSKKFQSNINDDNEDFVNIYILYIIYIYNIYILEIYIYFNIYIFCQYIYHHRTDYQTAFKFLRIVITNGVFKTWSFCSL